ASALDRKQRHCCVSYTTNLLPLRHNKLATGSSVGTCVLHRADAGPLARTHLLVVAATSPTSRRRPHFPPADSPVGGFSYFAGPPSSAPLSQACHAVRSCSFASSMLAAWPNSPPGPSIGPDVSNCHCGSCSRSMTTGRVIRPARKPADVSQTVPS